MSSAIDPKLINKLPPESLAILYTENSFLDVYTRQHIVDVFTEWLKTTPARDIMNRFANLSRDHTTQLLRSSGAVPMFDLLRNTADNRVNPRHKGKQKPDSLFFTMIDVEAVNQINNASGMNHQKTDDGIFAPLSRALVEVARHSDVVARKGGDEFVVFGLARNSDVGPMLGTAVRYGRSVLANMLHDDNFVSTSVGSMGLLLRSEQIATHTTWDEANTRIDAKEGLTKRKHNYANLTEAATLQRIYKRGDTTLGIGYLSVVSDGGLFVRYSSVDHMKQELPRNDFEALNAGLGIVEIDIKDIPRPDIS
ncbi:diguanylate cyclase [bacterium]|nr:diguanylate cyclase [bacterium]NBX98643.1 diguanylate cyclase [bacterium]NDC94080.1 diguanylate cyclase [bacterium]NDD83526.1 diguanylate cyclase [bacterium]NDG29327.1 diguanylate cyclase [bacterium]